MKQTSFRIYRLDGQPLDLELQEITNIVIRGNIGTVRYGFNYLDLGAEQAEILADAWAAFLLESKKIDLE